MALAVLVRQPFEYARYILRRAVLTHLPFALNPLHRNLDAYDGLCHALNVILRRVRN